MAFQSVVAAFPPHAIVAKAQLHIFPLLFFISLRASAADLAPVTEEVSQIVPPNQVVSSSGSLDDAGVESFANPSSGYALWTFPFEVSAVAETGAPLDAIIPVKVDLSAKADGVLTEPIGYLNDGFARGGGTRHQRGPSTVAVTREVDHRRERHLEQFVGDDESDQLIQREDQRETDEQEEEAKAGLAAASNSLDLPASPSMTEDASVLEEDIEADFVALPPVDVDDDAETMPETSEGLDDERQSGVESDDMLSLRLPWGAPGTLSRAVDAEFDAFFAKNKLTFDLSPGELERYRRRVSVRAVKSARAMDIMGNTSGGGSGASNLRAWERTLLDALQQELPVVTRSFVQHINGERERGWTARLASWTAELSMGDAAVLMGYRPDHELENTSLEHLPEEARRLTPLPGWFDSREQWPHCANTIGHVRNQGLCGSCWAMATASSLDGRLCIATGGRFAGPSAWMSAGYIASCYNLLIINGCLGGNPGYALNRAQRTFLPFVGGVPTGGEGGGTCVPYFASGDALSHFNVDKNVRAPRCPRSCTRPYPRSLASDKFYPIGSATVTTDLSLAKRALMHGGPIPMAFTVYKDFMAYASGYYDRTTTVKMGGHAVTVIGWETYRGSDYITAVNSWGERWGDKGLFKMRASCCSASFFISAVPSKQAALPLPLVGVDDVRLRKGLPSLRLGRRADMDAEEAAETARFCPAVLTLAALVFCIVAATLQLLANLFWRSRSRSRCVTGLQVETPPTPTPSAGTAMGDAAATPEPAVATAAAAAAAEPAAAAAIPCAELQQLPSRLPQWLPLQGRWMAFPFSVEWSRISSSPMASSSASSPLSSPGCL
eukprot:TRINITY_DN16750_c0_g1_i1.p1 TRINITY_DN16750_c0_g1~~TRINITY_DN16750_c0_g1_i1.p1  ORF type:complete len:837 (-),score=135.30 TRINITY_DN16750_c0_g1_i1:39-2549(-)